MTSRSLTTDELSYLRRAGSWGLLRNMAGWKVCMTGKMSMERSQLAVLVEAAGGVFTNSMSSSVRLLIVADDTVAWTTKMQAAEDAGTLVLRESEFAERLLPTPAELLSGERAPFPAVRLS